MRPRRLMRIGINTSILSAPLTGVGNYTLALVQALARVGKGLEFVLLGFNPKYSILLDAASNVELHLIGATWARFRVAWEQTALPLLAVRTGLDLLHCPDFSRPLLSSVPLVNTIHDLSYFASPPFFPLVKRYYKSALARVAVARSTGIIAVSHFTKEEILRRLRVNEKQVFVVHNGVDLAAYGSTETAERNVGPPYLLFVGTLEERKNIVTLIAAYNNLRSKGRLRHRLVLAGQPGWGWSRISASIRSSPFREDIEVRDYVSHDILFQLYQAADLFIYPSTYEGFGFPVLEAMACGTPVVCSRAASLPEVAGDGAEYFEPTSVEDLAATVERVLGSAERQAELRRRGLERVKLFSWDECARRHCEVYRTMMVG